MKLTQHTVFFWHFGLAARSGNSGQIPIQNPPHFSTIPLYLLSLFSYCPCFPTITHCIPSNIRYYHCLHTILFRIQSQSSYHPCFPTIHYQIQSQFHDSSFFVLSRFCTIPIPYHRAHIHRPAIVVGKPCIAGGREMPMGVVSVALLPFSRWGRHCPSSECEKEPKTARYSPCASCRFVMSTCRVVMPCRHRVMRHSVMSLCHGICQSVTIVPIHAATHPYIWCS